MASIALSKALGNVENYMKKGNQGLTPAKADILNRLVRIQDMITAKDVKIKNIPQMDKLIVQLMNLIDEPEDHVEGA
jgi:hypothetical protein